MPYLQGTSEITFFNLWQNSPECTGAAEGIYDWGASKSEDN